MEVYMHYIRNITKFLIITTILYIISFKISLHLNILDETNEAIIINLMTGFATSALISFVEYSIRLQENIRYFISDLILYYRTLLRLKRGLNSSISINEKIEAIGEEFKHINSNAKNKKQLIDIEFLFNSKNNKHFVEMIENTYELTFGIELCFIEINYKAKKKKTLKVKKEYVDVVKEIIDAEFKQIEENLKGLKKFQLYSNWLILKEKYILNKKENGHIT